MELFFLSLQWLPTIFLVLIVILSLSLLLKQRKVKKAYNLPPSPPKLPIIGNLHQVGKLNHRSLWKLPKKYGPAMLLQLGQMQTLVISSPQMAKEVLKTNDAECCTRPISYVQQKLTYNFLTLAFCPNNDSWKNMHKIFRMELLSKNRVQSFKYISEYTEYKRKAKIVELINYITQASPNPIELTEKALSLVCSVIQIEGHKFKEFVQGTMKLFGMFGTLDMLPWLGGIMDALIGLPRQIEYCHRRFNSFFEMLLEDHLDLAKQRSEQDIIDVLLSLVFPFIIEVKHLILHIIWAWATFELSAEFADPRFSIYLALFSTNQALQIYTDIVLGEVDTSSITIVWTMTELIRNPRVMKKAQAEIQSFVGMKPYVDESELENLQYLKMVVKETLRLHPPGTLLLPREVMSHFKIGEYDINPETRIMINNPNEFYPERFEDNAIDFRDYNFELLSFGSGRRMCPGINMASTVVMVTLANLLHRFDWKLPNGMKREDVSVEEGVGLNIYRKLPLYLVPIIYDFEKTLEQ
ncbi:hypothetical protein ACB098_05G115800 [Castanea mollissima]